MKAILDVFRFPLNKTGLAHIGLFTVLIFAMMFVEFVLSQFLGPIGGYVSLGLMFINALVGIELIQYLYLCTQQSAQGALVAADIIVSMNRN